MKRLLAFILGACLIMSACPALAAKGDEVILRRGLNGVGEVGVTSMAYVNGVLYMMGNEKVYVYDGELATHDLIVPAINENSISAMRALLADGDTLRALVSEYSITNAIEYSTTVNGLYLYTLSTASDGTLAYSDPVSLDFSYLIDGDEEYEYLRDISYPFIQDGKLIFTTYNDYGNSIMVYDIASNDAQEHVVENMNRVVPYKGGEVLVTLYEYDDTMKNAPDYYLAVLDVDTGDAERLFAFEVSDYEQPMGIAYDERTNNLYYQMNGELYKIENMQSETAVSVNAVQLEPWSDCRPIITDDGFYIATDYGTVLKRNTNPDTRAERRLAVENTYNDAVTNAYYAFESAHGDVEMRFISNVSDIIQAMMMRDDSVDVYYLGASTQAYASMFERGYLAELTGSEKLTAFVSDMYPAIRDMIIKNGELYALPLEINAYNNMGMRVDTMKKLGMTTDDMPKSWMELFEFFNNFPTLAEAYPGVTLFVQYYTQSDIKRELFFKLLQSYILYMQKSDDALMSFDTPVFKELVEALEQLDYDALGVPEEITDEMWQREEGMSLITTYADINASVYSMEYNLPMPLALKKDEAPLINAGLYMLVVNPFSQNRELAIEFLETVAELLPAMTRTQLCVNLNEPIKNEYYDMAIENQQLYLDSIIAQMENMDEADKAYYQEQVEQQKAYIEEYKLKYEYEANAESIAKFRAYADYFAPEEYFGMDEENSSEFYTLIYQYLDGAIDSHALIKSIDGKLRMMMLEGV